MLARSFPRALGTAGFSLLFSVGLGLSVLVVPSAAAPAPAAPAPDVPGSVVGVSSGQLSALLREAGLSSRQAEQRLAEEAEAADVVSTLRSALGGSFAGAWFEPGRIDLIVASTDPAAIRQIRDLGAVPRLVSLDLSTLNRVRAELDSRADVVPDQVTGWYVDPASNSVVVSATDPAAAEDFVAGLPGVRIRQVVARAVPLASLTGGDGIQTNQGARCSIGFSATAGEARYVVTAGHCTQLGGTWSTLDGTPIGPVAKSSFPGDDFGLIEVVSPAWQQSGRVSTSNGTVTVTGVGAAPVGSSVCRSGATTGYRCGTVKAVDETVNYGSGDVVHGLTRTSACAEAGDSGGPFIAGSQALGMLSGGSGNCLINLFGSETYFQPLGEALSTYNLTLVTGG